MKTLTVVWNFKTGLKMFCKVSRAAVCFTEKECLRCSDQQPNGENHLLGAGALTAHWVPIAALAN